MDILLPSWESVFTPDLKQTAAKLSTGKYLQPHQTTAGKALQARREGSDLGTQPWLWDSAVRTRAFRTGTDAQSVPVPSVSRTNGQINVTINCAVTH